MTHNTISKLKSQSKPTNPAKESFTQKKKNRQEVKLYMKLLFRNASLCLDKEKNLKKNGAAGEKKHIFLEGLDSMSYFSGKLKRFLVIGLNWKPEDRI